MAEKNDSLNSDVPTKQGLVAHDEFPQRRRSEPELLHVEYDNNGIAGIIRSPYVFGAAMLASMGGFSFGYGKVDLVRTG